MAKTASARQAFETSWKNTFSYDNINRCDGGKLFIQCNGYQVYQSSYMDEHFLFLKKITPSGYVIPEMCNQSRGYKLHVMVDLEDNNFKKAWEIVKDLILKHQVHCTKVIKDSSRDIIKNDPIECGKIITIDAYKENRDWKIVLTEITKALTENTIKPGILSLYATAIPGSEYLSFFNDGDPANQNPFKNLLIE